MKDLQIKEAMENKEWDVRLIERARDVGGLEEKAYTAHLSTLPDDSSTMSEVNLDDLMATDNPVHTGRNLPSLEPHKPQPFEDLELEEQAARLQSDSIGTLRR